MLQAKCIGIICYTCNSGIPQREQHFLNSTNYWWHMETGETFCDIFICRNIKERLTRVLKNVYLFLSGIPYSKITWHWQIVSLCVSFYCSFYELILFVNWWITYQCKQIACQYWQLTYPPDSSCLYNYCHLACLHPIRQMMSMMLGSAFCSGKRGARIYKRGNKKIKKRCQNAQQGK